MDGNKKNFKKTTALSVGFEMTVCFWKSSLAPPNQEPMRDKLMGKYYRCCSNMELLPSACLAFRLKIQSPLLCYAHTFIVFHYLEVHGVKIGM